MWQMMKRVIQQSMKWIRKNCELIKVLFEVEIIDIIISIIISTILEFGKIIVQKIVYVNTHEKIDGGIDIEKLKKIFCNETYDKILNIILLTLIIWGVSGLAKMMKESNIGSKNRLHTLSMLVVFISSILWYILKDFFMIAKTTLIISTVFCLLLICILCSYFVKNKTETLPKNKYQSDNRIA